MLLMKGKGRFADLLDKLINDGIHIKMDFAKAFQKEISIKDGALLKYKDFIFQ